MYEFFQTNAFERTLGINLTNYAFTTQLLRLCSHCNDSRIILYLRTYSRGTLICNSNMRIIGIKRNTNSPAC